MDTKVSLEWVVNTNGKIIHLRCVHSHFTFGSLYFSRRHTLSVARSAFLCKKSASLSILKWIQTCQPSSLNCHIDAFFIHVVQVLPDIRMIYWIAVSGVQMWNTPVWRCKPPMDVPDVNLCGYETINDIIWTATNQTSSWNLSLPLSLQHCVQMLYTIKYFSTQILFN